MFIVLIGIHYEGEQIVRVFKEIKDAITYAKASRGSFDCNYIEVVEWQQGWRKGKVAYTHS